VPGIAFEFLGCQHCNLCNPASLAHRRRFG
jgi:hypothetical protein